METAASLLDAGARFAQAMRAFRSRDDLGESGVTPQLAEMLSLLGEQPEWRVFVDGTRNLGHQASTVVVLRRLIDLTDFSGRVVVVCADHRRALLGVTAGKLALMFDGINPACLDEAVASYGSCREIRFLPFERRAELTEPCAFGFSGGADDMELNCALELNVRFFVRIQPYLWDDPPSAKNDEYYESSRIEQPDGKHLYLLESCPELHALPIKTASLRAAGNIAPEIWRWYADEQTFDVGLAHRTRNIRSILAACSYGDQRTMLWPLYGLQHFREEAAGMFLVCALAACRCAAVLRRSIVACSFSPSEELQGWADYIEALALDLRSARADLPALANALACSDSSLQPDRIERWAHILGAWLLGEKSAASIEVCRSYLPAERQWIGIGREATAAITKEGPPAVYVLELGPVPLDVFEHCVSRADLPSVVEGQATSNCLTGRGRPFLQVLRAEHVIKNGYATLPLNDFTYEMAQAMVHAAAELHHLQPSRWFASNANAAPQEYCERLDKLAALLVAARCESSAVRRYFELLGAHFRRNAHDKLLAALLALREVMLAKADL